MRAPPFRTARKSSTARPPALRDDRPCAAPGRQLRRASRPLAVKARQVAYPLTPDADLPGGILYGRTAVGSFGTWRQRGTSSVASRVAYAPARPVSPARPARHHTVA